MVTDWRSSPLAPRRSSFLGILSYLTRESRIDTKLFPVSLPVAWLRHLDLFANSGDHELRVTTRPFSWLTLLCLVVWSMPLRLVAFVDGCLA